VTAPIVTTHAADRYRERVVRELDFNEAHRRLRRIAATAEVSANAPLWLDRLAAQRGLRFPVGPGLRAGCGLVRGGAIVTARTSAQARRVPGRQSERLASTRGWARVLPRTLRPAVGS
jgi:hypothetical protein